MQRDYCCTLPMWVYASYMQDQVPLLGFQRQQHVLDATKRLLLFLCSTLPSGEKFGEAGKDTKVSVILGAQWI